MQTLTQSASSGPWWKFSLVWLVVGLPISVIVACAITAYFIWQQPIDLVEEDYYAKGLALSLPKQEAKLQPAQQARNHAQTGGKAPNLDQ